MPTKAPETSQQLQRKAAVIDEIKRRLTDSDAAVLTEYRGLTVHQIAELRAALRPAATDYKVFKNTLARRAVSDVGMDDVASMLEGPVAIAFVRKDGGDAVTAAKALRDFAKAHPALVLKGGMLGVRPLTSSEIEALADVPPREVILARLAGGFQAPLVKAAGLFQAFTRNFAYALLAYADQRADAEEPRTAERGSHQQGAESESEPTAAEPEPAPAPEETASEPESDAGAERAEPTE